MKQELPPLILASGSIWRRRLLKRNGFKVSVIVSDFNERKRGMSPEKLALYNARGKARRVAQQVKGDALIIGVDTIGVVGKAVLGKPRDRAAAKRMLQRLSGTTHQVISGLCLLDTRTGKEQCEAVSTGITFKEVTEAELGRYLDSGQWQGKAGSYAIQGRAKGFVKEIVGDVTNVVGLPIPALIRMLLEV